MSATSPNEPSATQTQPFQVNLHGVVDLLSRHIYSSPRVFLRELLQNGRDAIHRRAELAGEAARPEWGIEITPAEHGRPLIFRDEGVGLSLSEVGDLLATVGRSSKRDIFDLPRSDYLGQFGIGLLSCFMVADEIVMHTRSVAGSAPVEWIGHAAGTFTARELEGDMASSVPIGTTVMLRARADDAALVGPQAVLELARTFGEFLPIPVRLSRSHEDNLLISGDPVWREPFEPGEPSDAVLAYGRELIGAEPLDVIALSVAGTDTVGVAYVLPYAPSPGAHSAHRVYLGRMLLAENVRDLLPEWAFFVRCVVDTTALSPTASRESLVDDEALAHLRTELGRALTAWVRHTGTYAPARLATFVAIHFLALKALALHDDDLAAFILPWLPVETSSGRITIGELVRERSHIGYTESSEEFAQIASITTGDAVVVNGGYVYDADLMRRLPQILPTVTTERLTLWGELEQLKAPPLAVREAALRFEARAAEVLERAQVKVQLRRFRPEDVPALYLVDELALRAIDRRAAIQDAPGPWGGLLGSIDAQLEVQAGPADGSILCFNYDCPLVRTVMQLTDESVFARTVQLLYTQSLLAGHRPLRAVDRRMLIGAISDLVNLSAEQKESTK